MAQLFIDQRQSEAESKAREMTTMAQDRAREIINEARSRAEDEVQRLNGLKQRLSEDVEALTRQLETERSRVKTVLSELDRWIDDSMRMNTPRPAPVAATPAPAPVTSFTPESRPATPPPAPRPTIGDTLGSTFDQNN